MALEFRFKVNDRVVISPLAGRLPGESGTVVGRHQGPTGLPEYTVRLDRTEDYDDDYYVPERVLRPLRKQGERQ